MMVQEILTPLKSHVEPESGGHILRSRAFAINSYSCSKQPLEMAECDSTCTRKMKAQKEAGSVLMLCSPFSSKDLTDVRGTTKREGPDVELA